MTWPERVSFLILGLILAGWLYHLTYRVQLILDRAEQAVDNSDRLLGVATWQPEPDGEWQAEHEQRDVPQVPSLDEPTGPIPVVRTDTVDMHTAFNASAAELADRQPARAQVERTVNGHTFRVWEDA